MAEMPFEDNFISWLPIGENESLLQLTESPENLNGSWDWIVAADVFARVPSYFGGEDPYRRFFEKISEHLNPQGHLILAVDNRYGLAFFAGEKERLSGKYFEGIEGYPDSEGIATFSREKILKMAEEAGFLFAKTYYPYPDYRQMTVLYSDQRLPQSGEMNRRFRNLKEERLVLFDEGKVFDGLIADGRFAEFANCYLFDLTRENCKPKEEILYVKYSAERAPQYRIRTEILKKENGTRTVRKIPCGQAAAAHVRSLRQKEALLAEQCRGSGIRVNRCELTGQGAEFEFLYGHTLEEQLDRLLSEKKYTVLIEEIANYVNRLQKLLHLRPFKETEDFKEIFGNIEFHTPQKAADINNIDWIFSNIMITEDGSWNVIDYEWTFEFPIPFKFLVYRALVLYCAGNGRECLRQMGLYQIVGISAEEERIFAEMEHRLQLFLLGGTETIEAYHQQHEGKTIVLSEILHKAHQPEMKIYFDYGNGFSEEHSQLLEVQEDFYGRRRWNVLLPSGVTAVRLDPCEEMCQVMVNRMEGECGGSYPLAYTHNGRAFGNSVVYTTKDPQLLIENIVSGSSEIHFDLTVEYLKEETAYTLMKILQKAEKCVRLEASFPYRILKKIKEMIKKG